MTAKKKEAKTDTTTDTTVPEFTASQKREYRRYMNQHRLTYNAMTSAEWLEMTKVAAKKGQRRAG